MTLGTNNATFASLNQTNGQVTGSGNLTVSGAATLNNAGHSGPGTTLVQGATTIGTSGLDLDGGRLFRNEGTLTQSGQVNLNARTSGTPEAGHGNVVNALGSIWNTAGRRQPHHGHQPGRRRHRRRRDLHQRGHLQPTGAGTSSVLVLFNNSGTVRASAGTLNFSSSFDNQAGGVVEALADAVVRFSSSGDLSNLAGNTLTGGIWRANSVGGSSALIDLQFTNSSIATNAADIYLIGANSAIQGRSAGNVVQTLDQTLATNNGSLRLQQGRIFNATASGGNFNNSGLLELTDSTFSSSTLANNGTTTSFGNSALSTGVGNRVTGSGSITANSGALTITRGVDMGAGSSLTSAAGATVDLSSATLASQVATLANNGALNLGTQNIVVTQDYANANFGSGNMFNARANVVGTGLVIGNNAALALTGDVTQNGASSWTLDLGAVRGGTSKTVNFQVANTGTGADVRGAIQTAANGASITDVRLSGTGVTAGNFGPILAAGATGDYAVTFNAGSGGALSGQSVVVVSNFDNVTPLTLNLAGDLTSLAQGNATPAGAVSLGNFRVGGALPSQAFALQNVTTGATAESLGIASVGASGNFAATNNLGSGLIGPGASQANAITANASGAVAGLNTGTLTINYVSNGAAFDPSFTNVAANTQLINLSATGYNAAAGNAAPATPVNVGNARIGGSLGQIFTVTNTAATGPFSDDLNASFGASGGLATNNGGSINGLLAGNSNNSAMGASLDTGTFGAKSGTVTINYQTAGAVGGVDNSLGTASVGSQTITLNGGVYQVAQPAFGSTSLNLGNVRVGGSAQQALSVSNTNVAPGFQEGLSASAGGATAGITAGGSFANLAAGGSNNTSLLVGLNTSSAGAKSGTATVNLTSTGAGTSGLANLPLGAQLINVSGNVYQLAQGQLNTAPLNFGVVQVGQVVSQTLSISNVAAGPGGFVEDLNASFGATSGTGAGLISGTGSISGLLAGGTNATGMTVNVNTAAAGTVDGAIAVNFASAGAVGGASNGLGTFDLGSVNYGVVGLIQANVINTASPVINNSPINLGNVRVGATSPTAFVSVTNQTTVAPQAALNASIVGNAPITASGSFNLLDPGATDSTSLQVGMNTGTAGAINGTATIAFVSDANNVGGCDPNCQLNLASQNVTVTGGVYQVAQPNVPASVNLGNFRIGAAPTQAIAIVNTNVSAAGFQEGLDASVGALGGQATASGGPISNLAQGGSSGGIRVGINNAAATAGANAGTVTINLASNGTGTSGLGTLGLPSAVVNVSGTAYNAAAGNAAPSPTVNLGNARVGGSLGQTFTVSNIAAPGTFSEDLNASFGVSTGQASGSGAVSGLLAGANSTAMAGSLSTASAGARTGTVTINYQTAGAVNGVSNGLGIAGVGSQTITLNGNVYQLAQGQLNTAPLNFGVVQVGQVVSQTLSISNVAAGPGGFVEDLNASFGATSGTGAGLISGTGSISGLLAGGTNATGMTVNVNTAAAGTVDGAIAVNFASAGAVGGASNGLGTFDLGSVNYGVVGLIQANVINTASPVINNSPINLGNVRVGATSPTAFVSVTNQTTVAPQAALNASIVGNAPITASGSFNLLDPGATDSTSLQVGMNTGTAGAINGTATIAFVSDATNQGCTVSCQLGLASQTVEVNAKVYAPAVAQLNTSNVSFGIVRIGDAVAAQNVSVTNSAAAAALNDTLAATMAAVTGPFNGSGGATGLGAGGSNAPGSISVGLDTSAAGIFNGTASVAFASQNPDMADLLLASQIVALSGQVNDIAEALFFKTSGAGTLTRAGNEFTLDLGTLFIGEGFSSWLGLRNDVSGPADDLSGSFDFAAPIFSYLGFDSIAALHAGEEIGGLQIDHSFVSAGLFEDLIAFNWTSFNGSGPDLDFTSTLRIRANVVTPGGTVPEPATIALILMALAATMLVKRRRMH